LSVTAPISAGTITLQDTEALVGLRNGARSDNAKNGTERKKEEFVRTA